MIKSIQVFTYENQSIEFDFTNSNLMINATEMAKIFDKDVSEFFSNATTKSFIAACLNTGNSRFISVEKEEDLFVSRQKSGTWMHRILALKFAAWLNPDFEVWVYYTIDRILLQTYLPLEQNLKETVARRKLIAELENSLKETETYKKMAALQLEEKIASNQRGQIIKGQMELFAQ